MDFLTHREESLEKKLRSSLWYTITLNTKNNGEVKQNDKMLLVSTTLTWLRITGVWGATRVTRTAAVTSWWTTTAATQSTWATYYIHRTTFFYNGALKIIERTLNTIQYTVDWQIITRVLISLCSWFLIFPQN